MDLLKKTLRKTVVYPGLGIAAISMIFTGVSHQQARQAEYVRLCKNQATGKRVDDDDCEDGSSGSTTHGSYGRSSRWYWQPSDPSKDRVPAVGDTASGGSYDAPKNGVVYKNVPREGGSFEDAYRQAKSHDLYQKGRVKTSRPGGKSGRSGGFGGGGRTGGGHGG